MAQRTWNRSITAYIVVGIILIAAVIVTGYTVEHRGEVARTQEAEKIASQQAKVVGVIQQNPSPATSASSTAASSPANQSSATTTSSTPAELPKTGTQFEAIQTLELGIFTTVVVSYILSKRRLVRGL